jgi:hypothetical protein
MCLSDTIAKLHIVDMFLIISRYTEFMDTLLRIAVQDFVRSSVTIRRAM